MRNLVLNSVPKHEAEEDNLQDALQQTLQDIAYAYGQLAACRVWGMGSCGTKKQLMKALYPTSKNLTTKLNLDFREQSYRFHQPHVSPEVIPTL